MYFVHRALFGMTLLLVLLSAAAIAAPSQEEIVNLIRENLNAANLAIERKNYHYAVQLLKLNQKLVPNHHIYIVYEGDAHMMWANHVLRTNGRHAAKPYFLAAASAYEAAFNQARKNRAKSEELVGIELKRSHALVEAEAFKEAQELLAEILDFNASSARANYLMGLAMRREYESIAKDEPIPPADILFRSNRYFETAISLGPTELIPYAYFYTGVAYYELQNWSRADYYLRKWKEQFGTWAEINGLTYEDYTDEERDLLGQTDRMLLRIARNLTQE